MDALTAFGVNWKLLLIQGVNFGLLLIILYRYLYKPLFAMLEKRQGEIAKGLADAEAATREKDAIESAKTEILRSAREEGGEIVKNLRKQGTEAEHAMISDAQEKTVAMLAEARQKAEDERAHILRESEKDLARMAVLAAEKILRESPHHA